MSELPIERRESGHRLRLVQRARSEFFEMPGLSLTPKQAARLWGLREDICERIMRELVGEGVLRTGKEGQFSRT